MPLLWVSAAYAGSSCAATSDADVSGAVNEALIAYAAMDEDGFGNSLRSAKEMLACVHEQLSFATAAAMLRAIGLEAFIGDDPSGATKAFAAARHLDPKARLSPTIAPAGGALDLLWNSEEPLDVTATADLSLPTWAVAWVDGTKSTTLPANVPAVVQVGGDAPMWGTVLQPGESLRLPTDLVVTLSARAAPAPVPEPAPAPLVAPVPVPVPPSHAHHGVDGLVVTGLVLGLIGGGMDFGAFAANDFQGSGATSGIKILNYGGGALAGFGGALFVIGLATPRNDGG